MAAELEAEAKFLTAQAAADKMAAAPLVDENGTPFDTVDGQTRTIGGQLMAIMAFQALKQPVFKMREAARLEAERIKEQKLAERAQKKAAIVAKRQDGMRSRRRGQTTEEAARQREQTGVAASPSPVASPNAPVREDVNAWLAPPPGVDCPPGPAASSAPGTEEAPTDEGGV